MTPFRAGILRLAASEGAISSEDVVRDQPRNGNKRAAIKQLKALHALGLLAPIRTCEYVLTSVGQSWVDADAAARGGA